MEFTPTAGRPCCVSLRLLLFFAMQGAAVILVGFAALFVSFEPVWSAEGPTAGACPARRCALRLAAAEDRRRLCRRDTARHRRRPHRLRSDGPRPRHADLPQPDPGLGRGDLCLSAAGGRRGRHAENGGRRPRRGRRDQGAAAGPHHLRAGARERTEGGADRTGAAEHLHQLGRQYRPRRNRAGADRIPGAGAAVRQ